MSLNRLGSTSLAFSPSAVGTQRDFKPYIQRDTKSFVYDSTRPDATLYSDASGNELAVLMKGSDELGLAGRKLENNVFLSPAATRDQADVREFLQLKTNQDDSRQGSDETSFNTPEIGVLTMINEAAGLSLYNAEGVLVAGPFVEKSEAIPALLNSQFYAFPIPDPKTEMAFQLDEQTVVMAMRAPILSEDDKRRYGEQGGRLLVYTIQNDAMIEFSDSERAFPQSWANEDELADLMLACNLPLVDELYEWLIKGDDIQNYEFLYQGRMVRMFYNVTQGDYIVTKRADFDDEVIDVNMKLLQPEDSNFVAAREFALKKYKG